MSTPEEPCTKVPTPERALGAPDADDADAVHPNAASSAGAAAPLGPEPAERGAPAPAPVDISALMEQYEKRMLAASKQATQELLVQYELTVRDRFTEQSGRIEELRSQVATLEQDRDSHHTRLVALESRLALISSADNEVAIKLRDEASFTRDPLPNILRAGVPVQTTIEAMRETVATLFTAVGGLSEQDWKVSGAAQSRNFIIEFAGSPALGATNASRVMDHIRNGGSWREVHIQGTTNKVFISYDKSPQQLAKEAAGRRLFRAIKEELAHLHKPVRLLRGDGVVCVDWVPVVRVSCDAPGKTEFFWNARQADLLKIDREKVKRQVAASRPEGSARIDDVEWSRG